MLARAGQLPAPSAPIQARAPSAASVICCRCLAQLAMLPAPWSPVDVVGLGHVHHEVGGRAEPVAAGEEQLLPGRQVVGAHNVPRVRRQGQGVAVHAYSRGVRRGRLRDSELAGEEAVYLCDGVVAGGHRGRAAGLPDGPGPGRVHHQTNHLGAGGVPLSRRPGHGDASACPARSLCGSLPTARLLVRRCSRPAARP